MLPIEGHGAHTCHCNRPTNRGDGRSTVVHKGCTGGLSVSICLTSLDHPEISIRPDLLPPLDAFPSPENRFKPPDLETTNLATTFRHSGWQLQRLRVHKAMFRTRQSSWRREAFRTCGSNAFVYESVDEPGQYKIGGSACRDRFCVPCTRQRAQVVAANVRERLDGQRARFVTLTIKTDGLSLRESISKLQHAFSRLQRTTLWQTTVTGGAAFLEIKYDTEAGRWHPHVHAITQGKFIPHSMLRDTWKGITTDSYIVHIRLIRSVESVLHYVTTYCSKAMRATDFPDDACLDEAIEGLRGVRLCRTFGTWRGQSLTEAAEDGDWRAIAPLSEILRRSLAGDADALKMLIGINTPQTREFLHTCEPRPPPLPVAVPITSTSQPLLFPGMYSAF